MRRNKLPERFFLTGECFKVDQNCIGNNEENEREDTTDPDGDRQTTLLLRLFGVRVIADLFKCSWLLQTTEECVLCSCR